MNVEASSKLKFEDNFVVYAQANSNYKLENTWKKASAALAITFGTVGTLTGVACLVVSGMVLWEVAVPVAVFSLGTLFSGIFSLADLKNKEKNLNKSINSLKTVAQQFENFKITIDKAKSINNHQESIEDKIHAYEILSTQGLSMFSKIASDDSFLCCFTKEPVELTFLQNLVRDVKILNDERSNVDERTFNSDINAYLKALDEQTSSLKNLLTETLQNQVYYIQDYTK